MKFLIVMVLLAVSSLAAPMDDKAEIDFMNKLIAECKAIEKTSDADVALLRKKVLATSKEAKCLIGCLFEKLGMLVNGKFSKANSDKTAEQMFADTPDMLKKAKATNDGCDKLSKSWGADKCANGPALLACMKKYEPDLELIPGK